MAVINGTSTTFTSTVTDDATRELSGAAGIATATVGGTAYVYVGGLSEAGIEILTLNGSGILSSVGQVADVSLSALNGVYGMETFSVGGNQFLAAVGRIDNGLSVFSLSGSGPFLTLTDSAFQTANANYNLSFAYDVEAVTTSGGTFLYVASPSSNGVSVCFLFQRQEH